MVEGLEEGSPLGEAVGQDMQPVLLGHGNVHID